MIAQSRLTSLFPDPSVMEKQYYCNKMPYYDPHFAQGRVRHFSGLSVLNPDDWPLQAIPCFLVNNSILFISMNPSYQPPPTKLSRLNKTRLRGNLVVLKSYTNICRSFFPTESKMAVWKVLIKMQVLWQVPCHVKNWDMGSEGEGNVTVSCCAETRCALFPCLEFMYCRWLLCELRCLSLLKKKRDWW